MKIKIRSQEASSLHMDGWLQMDGVDEWLAELRVDAQTGPLADGEAEAQDAEDTAEALSPDLARLRARAEARAEAEARTRAAAREPAGARTAQAEVRVHARTQAPAPAQSRPPGRPEAGDTARAVIGDQLRIPVMWCEMGSCVAWYADRAALGEADTRARALEAGWLIDAVGRLACPSCQQNDPCFWAPYQVVPWDRYLAMARAARAAAVSGRD
jgi:hypothetical protein